MYQNYMPRQNSINWVQGIEGAKAFQMFPGCNTVLMDSENEGVFYIKTCDNVGMCNLRTFKFQEVQSVPKTEYITKDEFYQAIEELRNEQSIQQFKSNESNDITTNQSTTKNSNGNGKK